MRGIACEQAHLVCYSRKYLGGGAAICESANEASPSRRFPRPILLADSQIAAPPPNYSPIRH